MSAMNWNWWTAGTHGETKNGKSSPEYRTWCSMRTRCYNKNDIAYHRYGGRDVKVCKRWRESFENFLADVGRKPSPKHSLDRFPNKNGDYKPGNVRWATRKEQAQNMCSNTNLTIGGETRCLTEWIRVRKLNAGTVWNRIYRGWSARKAITTPVKKRLTPT